MPEGRVVTIMVEPQQEGTRLDRLLAEAAPEFSRSRIKGLIEAGMATVNGILLSDPSHRVKSDYKVCLHLPPHQAALPPAPQTGIKLNIIYEDADVVVIDKPAGLTVHPGAGTPDGTLVNALLQHCGSLPDSGGADRPGIVHRLDKDTSGLLVTARSAQAMAALQKMFKERSIRRIYKAVVVGVPALAEGRVEGNIGRDPRRRLRMAVLPPTQGKPAATNYRLLQRFGDKASLLECRLESGRTHQIRVHMASIGHPLLGDVLYGSGRVGGASPGLQAALRMLNRQALHAESLCFRHPISGGELFFFSKLPEDMQDLLQVLEKE